MKEYDHLKVEKKWQKEWEKNKKSYQGKDFSKEEKYYSLMEFPYPSADGLHTGHVRGYTAMDIISRKRRMEGYNVLYPIGWDAFGLPTENFAIKTGKQPALITKKNTDNFRKQFKSLGMSFDWSREVNTTDPKYYKWTQWIFLQFFKKGLAYKAKAVINWCPSCKIGLANEEVVAGACERCGTPVEKREKEQWMLAITKYAERLDKDLDTVDYLPQIKLAQRNWIGKSEGAIIQFSIRNFQFSIEVFTTRPDTIFGATYLVLAPEHKLVESLKLKVENKEEVEKYVKDAKKKTEIERTALEKSKTGVELKGIKAINPATKEEIPVWIADYVLPHYGTGAIMAVPAHDERDFEFAKKYNLPIRYVVEPKFVGTSSEAAPKPELPYVKREAVCAIVRNPKNDTYLCISWKNFLMHGLVTGGMEPGEDIVETARREVLEETGYKNLKFNEVSPVLINTFFYHRQKKENRWAHFRFAFFELENEEQVPIPEEESSRHEILWKKKEELKDFFTVFEGEFLITLLDDPDFVFTGEGIMGNSGKFDTMDSEKAKKEIIKFVGGKEKTTFKLRDWVFSRQRYWGEPIPIIHCDKCGYVPVPEKDLPVELPKVKNYQPPDSGESPLANIKSFVDTRCPLCKGKAKRETDTMPNWAGSSWYFLRYTDPKNSKTFADPKKLKYWTPIDWYNGGMEHTTLHLLYSRFWHKFLFDLELVPTSEPYKKRTSHGLILAEGGEKMSKSKGNVINPDDIVKRYGADTLRLYEMFMGPFDQAIAWSEEAIIGPRRFLEKVWKLASRMEKNSAALPASGLRHGQNFSLSASLNKTIKKVTEDIEAMKFNTAISALMIFATQMQNNLVSKKDFKIFLQLLAPFAPHLTEELWHLIGEKKSINSSKWPEWYADLIQDEEVKIVVQVNGKVRGEIVMPNDAAEEDVKNKALANPAVLKHIQGKNLQRVIYVRNKLINIVV